MINIIAPILGSLLVGIGCYKWGVSVGLKRACMLSARAFERFFRYLEFDEKNWKVAQNLLVFCQKEIRSEEISKKPLPLNPGLLSMIHSSRAVGVEGESTDD